MKLAKKLLCCVMIGIISIAAFGFGASADSFFDTAKEIESGVTQKDMLEIRGDSADYKIKVATSGTLTVQYDTRIDNSELWVYDSDGELILISEISVKSGRGVYSSEIGADHVCGEWDKSTEKFSATVKYKVKKGTYYIQLHRGYRNFGGKDGSGYVSLKATFPDKEVAKIAYLTLDMEKGSSIKLGAVLTSGTGKVTWSSSKKSVASVSSTGKVTAKNTGTALISAKCGGKKVKIKIIVN